MLLNSNHTHCANLYKNEYLSNVVLFLIMCLCWSLCLYAVPVEARRGCQIPRELEVIGNCEPPNTVLETECGTSASTVCGLNCWFISPAPHDVNLVLLVLVVISCSL